jgi:hypothetical protein
MKKIHLWISFVLLSSLAYSCDICGCAASSFSLGMLPNSKYHVLGLRSNSRFFESQDAHLKSRNSSKEQFSSLEFNGKYRLNKRIQFMAFVPYVYNSKQDSVSSIKINGLGDISLLSNFVFIDNTDSLSKKFKQAGTIGLGVKMPTGLSQKLNFFETNMLPGTGAFDYIANLNYSIQFRSFGFQNESSFTYKTENKFLYRFGNAFSSTNLFFYRINVNENFKIIPQLGINFNHNWQDIKNGQLSEDTYNGGNILNGQFSLFLLYKSWGISSQVLVPIFQNLNQGYVVQKAAFRLSINYFISKK